MDKKKKILIREFHFEQLKNYGACQQNCVACGHK